MMDIHIREKASTFKKKADLYKLTWKAVHNIVKRANSNRVCIEWSPIFFLKKKKCIDFERKNSKGMVIRGG